MVARSSLSSLFAVVLLSISALVTGCSGGVDRPEAAIQGSSPTVFSAGDEEGLDTQESTLQDDEPCDPGERRVCKRFWRDGTGQINCPESTQFCAEDGSHWDPCGDFLLEIDGSMRPSWSE